MSISMNRFLVMAQANHIPSMTRKILVSVQIQPIKNRLKNHERPGKRPVRARNWGRKRKIKMLKLNQNHAYSIFEIIMFQKSYRVCPRVPLNPPPRPHRPHRQYERVQWQIFSKESLFPVEIEKDEIPEPKKVRVRPDINPVQICQLFIRTQIQIMIKDE